MRNKRRQKSSGDDTVFGTKVARDIFAKIYGVDAVCTMEEIGSARDDVVPVGIPAFDYGLLGIGGLPRGHFVEISGVEKSGKTTLLLHMVAACQKRGIVPIVLDSKGAVVSDIDRAKIIGVDPKSCILAPIDTSEGAEYAVRRSIQALHDKGVAAAFFWDDMGLTPTVYELNPAVDKKSQKSTKKVGDRAQVIWSFCRALAGACYRTKTIMVVVNQLSALINTGWTPIGAPTETTMGGGGLKYTARIRVVLRRGKKISGPNRSTIGHETKAEVIANSFFPSSRKVLLFLEFTHGYNGRKSTLLNGLQCGVLKMDRGKVRVTGSPRGTAYTHPEDLSDEDIRGLEAKLWPWITGGPVTYGDTLDQDSDVSEEEIKEDDFADGYV